MFGVVLAFFFTAMLGYIFWSAASVPFVRHHVSQKLLIGIGPALWASFFLSRVVGPEELRSLATALELWSMTWMATLFLMSAALLAVDAATGFGLFLTRSGNLGQLTLTPLIIHCAPPQGARAPAGGAGDHSARGGDDERYHVATRQIEQAARHPRT